MNHIILYNMKYSVNLWYEIFIELWKIWVKYKIDLIITITTSLYCLDSVGCFILCGIVYYSLILWNMHRTMIRSEEDDGNMEYCA